MRYSDFSRKIIGRLSRKMLTQTLRRLEQDGLLVRTVYPVVPPKVEYELTASGKKLAEAVNALHEWATKNQDDLKAVHARRRRLRAKTRTSP
jgi:DNA-binding HxlR family transcriptional regulator